MEMAIEFGLFGAPSFICADGKQFGAKIGSRMLLLGPRAGR